MPLQNTKTLTTEATAAALAAVESLSANNSRYLTITATMTSATWNTAASHEVFTTAGLVRIRMWIRCTTNLGSVGDGATLIFGTDLVAAAFISSTNEDAIDSGDLWYSATPAANIAPFGDAVMDYVVNGVDIGYTVAGEALNAGVLVFHCVWEPLNASGSVAAGAGGAL